MDRLVEIAESPVATAPGLTAPPAPSQQHGVSFDRTLEVGPVTRRLQELFRENAAATPDP